MIATIQGVPSRNKMIQKLKKNLSGHLDVHIHIDSSMCGGSFYPFTQMLEKFPRDQYRLHLQDDVELCEDFVEVLPYFEKLVKERDIDFLSLYAPKRKSFTEEVKDKGYNIVVDFNSVWIQCSIMSPRLLDILHKEVDGYIEECRTTNKYNRRIVNNYPSSDDTFIVAIMKKYGIKGYCFLPSLAQHLVEAGSMLGHADSDTRASGMYDRRYLQKLKNKGEAFWKDE